jgi:hypothetical protein
MFQPYLANHRKLLIFQNRHTAQVLKSDYFNAYTFFIVHQNWTFINNSSASHVQMGLLEVQFTACFGS